MKSKTTSIIAATILLVGTISTMTPLDQVSAESSCMVGFSIVTNAEAASLDPQVPEIDANADALLCMMEVSTGQGSPQVLFTDNAESNNGRCPDHFTRTSWPTGVNPDRNHNGFVCEKEVSSGKNVNIDDNKQCENDCAPAPPVNGKIAF